MLPAFSLRPLGCCKKVLLVLLYPACCLAGGADSPLDEAGARAWLNRFGYGADSASLNRSLGKTPRQLIQQALHQPSYYPASLLAATANSPANTPLSQLWPRYGPGGSEQMDQPARRQPEGAEVQRSQREVDGRQLLHASVELRLLESANADNQAREALLNFWLNHFSIHGQKTITQFLTTDYTRQLAQALQEDSFSALLKASFFHPAMQIYLDNHRSVAPESRFAQRASRRGEQLGINENLARELLELHTLGLENGRTPYLQADVQALARILTGAGILNNRLPDNLRTAPGSWQQGYFFFDPNRHDFGEKTLLGQHYPAGQGIEEIHRALDQLARHPATARHITTKLARRFLADDPPERLINAMSQAFLNSHGRISASLQPLLDSPEFTQSLLAPRKFKEPLDYLLSAARAACDGRPIQNGRLLAHTAQDAGQAPFMRSTPDGYGSQESDWLSAPAMSKRIRVAQALANGQMALAGQPGDSEGKQRDPNAFCHPDPNTFARLIGPLSPASQATLSGLSPREANTARLASPEFMRR